MPIEKRTGDEGPRPLIGKTARSNRFVRFVDLNDYITRLESNTLDLDASKIVYVYSVDKLPKPIGNEYHLEEGYTYIITRRIDLNGKRIVCDGVVNLFGISSETSFLTSTGLPEGVPLISTKYTLVLEALTIEDVHTALDVDGTERIVALDWKALNFSGVPFVGRIDSPDNFIYDTGAFLGAQGLRFTGTIGTVGLNNSLFQGLGIEGDIITVDSDADITRRFRLNYSSIVSFGDTNGINFSELASVPTESFILDTANFSGSAQNQYLPGINHTSNKALFVNCVGIINTAVNGQMYMQNNATPTVVATQDVWYKVAGVTLPSVDNSLVLHDNNRLTIDAIISRKYLVRVENLTFISGNNNIVEFGFYDSELDGIRVPSRTKATANSAGRAENISLGCVITGSQDKYVEVWARNKSAATNIVVESMNTTMTEIK